MNHENQRLARGAWYGLLAQAVDKILPVAILLYLARTLEQEDFGVYTFIIAYLAFFQTATEYSIDTVLVRTMSQLPEKRNALLQAGLGLKLATAVLAALLATLLAGPVSGGRAPLAMALLASLGMVTAMGSAYRSWLRAQLRIGGVFGVAAGRALLLGGGVFVAVRVGMGLYAIFVAIAAANLVAFLGIALWFRRSVTPRARFERESWALLIRGALPLAGNAFAMTVSLRVGQILLMSMRGAVDVGMLAAASRVSEAFSLLPEALMISVYPLMAGLHLNDLPRLLSTAERSTRYLMLATGVPVVVCAVAGPEVMALLFGPSFADAGPALSILVFMALFSASGTVIINLLVAAHREKVLYFNTMAFAAASIPLSYALISRGGYTGAAVAILVTSGLSQAALALLPSTGLYVRSCLLAGVKPFAAAVAASACGLVVGWTTATALVVALGVYAAALFALGVLDADELNFIRSLLGLRPNEPQERP